MSETRKLTAAQTTDNRPCFFRYITAITRTWGILTSVALWYLAVSLIQHRDEYIYVQWYTLFLAAIVTFLEIVWIITKSACCKDDGNCCCAVWRIVLWLDEWKKSIFYVLISLPIFSQRSIGILAGVLVILLAIVYLFKACRNSEFVIRKMQGSHELISQEVQTSTTDNTSVRETDGTTRTTVTIATETKATETEKPSAE